MIANALICGLIWSALWIVYVFIILKKYPSEMLHDYPDDIQKASTLPEPSETQKKQARLFSGIGGGIIILSLTIFGIIYFRNTSAPFLMLFVYILIIAMSWNVIDLIVMDWLIICCITPKWVVIEGTEGCKGYKDYLFHFKGFLIGCVYSTLMALIFSGIDYAILKLIQ